MKEAAICVFYTQEKKILLQERKGIARFDEDWSFFGGRVEPGEHSDDTIAREIKEELAHDLQGHTYIGHLQTNDPDGSEISRDIYIAHMDENMTLQEGSAMALFSLQEAKQLKMCPGDDEVLKLLKDVI